MLTIGQDEKIKSIKKLFKEQLRAITGEELSLSEQQHPIMAKLQEDLAHEFNNYTDRLTDLFEAQNDFYQKNHMERLEKITLSRGSLKQELEQLRQKQGSSSEQIVKIERSITAMSAQIAELLGLINAIDNKETAFEVANQAFDQACKKHITTARLALANSITAEKTSPEQGSATEDTPAVEPSDTSEANEIYWEMLHAFTETITGIFNPLKRLFTPAPTQPLTIQQVLEQVEQNIHSVIEELQEKSSSSSHSANP